MHTRYCSDENVLQWNAYGKETVKEMRETVGRVIKSDSSAEVRRRWHPEHRWKK